MKLRLLELALLLITIYVAWQVAALVWQASIGR